MDLCTTVLICQRNRRNRLVPCFAMLDLTVNSFITYPNTSTTKGTTKCKRTEFIFCFFSRVCAWVRNSLMKMMLKMMTTLTMSMMTLMTTTSVSFSSSLLSVCAISIRHITYNALYLWQPSAPICQVPCRQTTDAWCPLHY
jgi:hypothetical protein